VRLVANDQVPFRRSQELAPKILVAREHVETDDQLVAILERIARARGFDHVARKNRELEVEFLAEFILPLFDQTAWSDD
jgi:hypothetical protein